MRLLRHPFGINADDLRRRLERRNRAHSKALAGTGARIERLRAANAERRRYLSLLQEELAALLAEEQTLAQMLHGDVPDSETAQLAARLAALQDQLTQTRVWSLRIAEGVFHLIGPFLHQDTRRCGVDVCKKGEQQVHGSAPQSLQTAPHLGGARRPGNRL